MHVHNDTYSSWALTYLISGSQTPQHIVCAAPSTFWNMLSQRLYHCLWWSWPGQQRVHFGAGWHWLCQTEGKLQAASHRSNRCSLLATKLCHGNTIQVVYTASVEINTNYFGWMAQRTELVKVTLRTSNHLCFSGHLSEDGKYSKLCILL